MNTHIFITYTQQLLIFQCSLYLSIVSLMNRMVPSFTSFTFFSQWNSSPPFVLPRIPHHYHHHHSCFFPVHQIPTEVFPLLRVPSLLWVPNKHYPYSFLSTLCHLSQIQINSWVRNHTCLWADWPKTDISLLWIILFWLSHFKVSYKYHNTSSKGTLASLKNKDIQKINK